MKSEMNNDDWVDEISNKQNDKAINKEIQWMKKKILPTTPFITPRIYKNI